LMFDAVHFDCFESLTVSFYFPSTGTPFFIFFITFDWEKSKTDLR